MLLLYIKHLDSYNNIKLLLRKNSQKQKNNNNVIIPIYHYFGVIIWSTICAILADGKRDLL